MSSWGRTFQREKAASPKVPKQEYAWCVCEEVSTAGESEQRRVVRSVIRKGN